MTSEMEAIYEIFDARGLVKGSQDIPHAKTVVRSDHLVAALTTHYDDGVITLSVPGSRFFCDWLNNACCWPDDAERLGLTGRVHSGYLSLAEKLLPAVDAALASHIPSLRDGRLKLVGLGHSRGGAVAALVTASLARRYDLPPMHVGVVLCNPPAFCDKRSKKSIEDSVAAVHFSKAGDIVGGMFDWFYDHAGDVTHYRDGIKSAIGHFCDWAPWFLAGAAATLCLVPEWNPMPAVTWSAVACGGLAWLGSYAYENHRNPFPEDVGAFLDAIAKFA